MEAWAGRVSISKEQGAHLFRAHFERPARFPSSAAQGGLAGGGQQGAVPGLDARSGRDGRLPRLRTAWARGGGASRAPQLLAAPRGAPWGNPALTRAPRAPWSIPGSLSQFSPGVAERETGGVAAR